MSSETRHSTHVLLSHAGVPVGQSVSVVHATQVLLLLHNCLSVGQSESVVHSTQVLLLLHNCLSVGQSESVVHSTHRPVTLLHWPFPSSLQTLLSFSHVLHVLSMQYIPFELERHSEFWRHSTQVLPSHTGLFIGQSAFFLQSIQVLLSPHTWASGQSAFFLHSTQVLSSPHTGFPLGQSEFVLHSTQVL
jgi:hypothetical protein